MTQTHTLPHLTVNWHLLEPCNFRCGYCFAKWRGSSRSPVRDRQFRDRMLNEISSLADRRMALESGSVDVGQVRLNFAGGEPFLVREIGELIEAADAADLTPSFISNGSLVTDEFIERHAPIISMAGFSFDAEDIVTARRVGRVDRRGRPLSPGRLEEMVDRFREANPEIRIKINTVVCAENAEVDLNAVLARLRPDRWKVLRVLPVIGAEPISDVAFAGFVARHRTVPGIAVEDNDDMRGSYLMIDPLGRLYQNTADGDYLYSSPIPEVGIGPALRQVPFHPSKFQQRYV